VYVGLPDIKGREEILKIHVRGKPLAEDVDLKQLAQGTAGFTGADLENMVNEGALLAGRKDRRFITMEDLKEAEIKARQAKENLALASKHNAAEQAATQYDAAQVRQAGRDARADAVADRAYNEGVRQFNATEKRLADAKAAEL
jgi:ATP-dependent Zn protease